MKKALIAGASFLLPVLAGAQLTNVQDNIITPIGNIINMLIPIVFALAMLYFFWGLAQYILNSGDSGKQEEWEIKQQPRGMNSTVFHHVLVEVGASM